MPAADRASLTVDLDALAANFHVLREVGRGAEVAPVVKADAYGLGAAAVARRLRTEGAQSFFVARLGEGVALRAALGDGPAIHVFDGCPEGAAGTLTAHALIPVLSSLEQVAAWSRALGGPAALHVDTGMNRLGVTVEEAQALAQSPDRLRHVDIGLVMSHLACALTPSHPMNPHQRDAFAAVAERFPHSRRSLSATAGMFLGADHAFEMVRPGIGLYGGGPFDAPDPRFTAVATLTAPILQVRTVRPGQTIGYGAAFTARETLRVAVVAAGYADGVLRAQGPRAYGVLDGRRCAALGRISMDLTAFDVTDCDAARPGERIELLGAQVNLDEVAAAAGTIAHDVLLSLRDRIAPTYVGAQG